MSMYIFCCDSITQMECFEKSLFGDNRNWPLQVKKNDTCFLYNYHSKSVMGVWKAEENGRRNIIPDAWNGNYPYQVKVKQVSKERLSIPSINLNRIFRNFPNFFSKSIVPPQIRNDFLQFFAAGYMEKIEKGHELTILEEDFRRQFPRNFHCSDGHDVRSRDEMIIDNWLSMNHVYHEYERLINIKEQLIPDFTVYDISNKPVYIEYWGLIGKPEYDRRRLKKCEIYSTYLFPLIELYPAAIKNIDFSMKTELQKKKIELNVY